MGVDPEQLARLELAEAGVPTPDDLIEGLSPLASLLYLGQLAWGALNVWTAWLSQLEDADQEGSEDVTRAMQALSMAVGNLDQACAAVALIPEGAAVPDELPPVVT